MLGVPEFLGHPMINGEEMYALAASDLFFRWQPNANANLYRVHHPLPHLDLEISPAAQFGGYPPALAPNGVVVADDATNRFLTILSGHAQQRWHADVAYSLGVPAVSDGVIYTGAGGDGATKSVMAIDADTSSPIWTYSPVKLLPDRQVMKPYKSTRTIQEPIVETEPGDRKLKNGASRVRITGFETHQVPVKVMQPNSLKPFAHWSNSGLVVTSDRVYAEVDHEVVALDKKDGSVVWKYPLGQDEVVRSIVGTPDHLIFAVSNLAGQKREPIWDRASLKSTENRIIAVKLADGKVEWSEKVQRPGSLAIANGMLYYMDGNLHTYSSAKQIALIPEESSNR
jgi:outer membrane protein assembly factor BamB